MNETQEDDALITTLNIESAVEKINWTQTHDKHLFCITQDECIQLWNYEEVVLKVIEKQIRIAVNFANVVKVLTLISIVFNLRNSNSTQTRIQIQILILLLK